MKIRARRVLPLLLALGLAGPLQGQDQPKTPAPIARFSIASFDALAKLAGDLGIPHMDEFKKSMEDAPFLETGSVDMGKPFGFAIVAGDPQKIFPGIWEGVIIGVPMAPGKVSMETLTKAGAKAVEGEPNTVTATEFTARRSTDYLFVKGPGTNTFGLQAMTDAMFAPEYKQAGTVAAMSLNFDLFRKIAPESYKDLANNIEGLPMALIMGPGVMGMGAAPQGNAETGKSVLAVLDKIDRFTLTVGQDDKNIHLRTWLAPTPFTAKAKSAPRPAFPAGTMMQLHVVFPDGAAAGFMEKQVEALPEEMFSDLPPVLRSRAKEVLVRAAHLSSQSDAISLGFAMKEGHAVFYLVDQFSENVDGPKEISEIAAQGIAVATEGGTKIAMESTNYEAGGKKIQRITLAPDGEPTKVAIDALQSEKVLYITLTDNTEAKYVGDLAGAGMEGTSSILCAGAVDLGGALTALGASGGIPGLTPDKLETLKKSWAGQGLTWTVQSSEQNFLYFDVSVPTEVVKEFVSRIFQ